MSIQMQPSVEAALHDLNQWIDENLQKHVEMVMFGDEGFLKESLNGICDRYGNRISLVEEVARIGVQNGLRSDWVHEYAISDEQLSMASVSIGDLKMNHMDMKWLSVDVVDRSSLLDLLVLRLDAQAFNDGEVARELLDSICDMMDELNTTPSDLKRLNDVLVFSDTIGIIQEYWGA